MRLRLRNYRAVTLSRSRAGILDQQYGGVVDESFIALLSADHGEVLREGEFGDELVSIEDRLIKASLNSYTGKDKRQVEDLFLKFAVFPEARGRGLFS